ncbi:uncharacterized protein MELLADRAFT_103744 [Melampsora larici-populina 98AG31]|uniref:Uncharacterized protein n=1 Tax=Melampsora larici-populina (strain 98AG31 / pathotype 3-4-7) TaxID=747676 RepID=F4RC84_MELLP|nr:uncharacterized protein MELLADRAFT_103744 [Melampsora larici-populina 98AG31]EGG09696.1 hypothetical protein MELLADRAFT_103744 [Melampsora larici-populina 98AG31]
MSASTSNIHEHPLWPLVQTLDKELLFFLAGDVDYLKRSCKKELFVAIMRHFQIRSDLRKFSLKKHELVSNYKEYLEPQLAPFIKQKSAAEKTQEHSKRKQAAFLNLSSASLAEIRAAVITRVRACFVPSTFPKGALVRLWKHVFDGPNGPEEEDPVEFCGRVHYFTVEQLPGKKRDILRYHLQHKYPNLFIPIAACTEPILCALYECFIHENVELDAELCVGVHYFIIEATEDQEPVIPKDTTDGKMLVEKTEEAEDETTGTINGRMNEKGTLISHTTYKAHQKADHRMEVLKKVSVLQPDRGMMRDPNGVPSPPYQSASPNPPDPQNGRYQAFRPLSPSLLATNERLTNQPSTSTHASAATCGLRLDQDIDMTDVTTQVIAIDTSACFDRKFTLTEPVVLHAALVVAMLSIFEHASLQTSAWMLTAQKDQTELTIKESNPDSLLYLNKLAGAFPRHVGTIISWLKIDPKLNIFTCCPSCFALYRLLNWHVRCFWSMSDETDTNPEGDPFSSSELRALLTTDLAPLPSLEEDQQVDEPSEPASDSEPPLFNFRDLPAFNSDTDPSDDDFDPLLFEGWNGELEITFMKNFGRAGNLSALLKEGKFPVELDPYLPQLQSLLNPIPFTRKTDPIHDQQPLNEEFLIQLVNRLNSNQSEGRSWLSSQTWSTLTSANH